MDSWNEQIKAVFDAVAEPVLAIRSGEICYRNPAAERQLPRLSAGECAEFGETAVLNHEQWQIVRRSLDDVMLLLFRRQHSWSAADRHTMNAFVKSMRSSLSVAMLVSKPLFLRLEEQEDLRIQHETAMLNRCFYQILRLTEHASEYAVMEQGEYEPQFRVIEIVNWLAEKQLLLESCCEICGRKLSLELPHRTCKLLVDSELLERALLGLLSNAIKYSPQGGQIFIRLELLNGRVLLSVTDEGDGISAAAQEETNGTDAALLRDPRDGAGLGMKLARQAAALHGGTLLTECLPEGGTRVVLTLELQSQHDSSGPLILKSPPTQYAYRSFEELVRIELADVLPPEYYDSENVN